MICVRLEQPWSMGLYLPYLIILIHHLPSLVLEKMALETCKKPDLRC